MASSKSVEAGIGPGPALDDIRLTALAVGGLIFVIRHRPRSCRVEAAAGGSGNRQNSQPRWSNVPVRTFADVGGMDEQKRRISAVVQNRLHPERFKQHGVVQNGILLYEPRGTGKTFLAEATAGEFGINYWMRSRPVWLNAGSAAVKQISEKHLPALTPTGRCCFSWTRLIR